MDKINPSLAYLTNLTTSIVNESTICDVNCASYNYHIELETMNHGNCF